MKIDAAADHGVDERFPLHDQALDRHASWARQFAAIGEMDCAIVALLDLRALASELRCEPPRVSSAS